MGGHCALWKRTQALRDGEGGGLPLNRYAPCSRQDFSFQESSEPRVELH